MREHARFGLAVGAAPLVVGGIMISVGVVQVTDGQVWDNPWFLWGFVVVGLGVCIELVSVGLYVGSRDTATRIPPGTLTLTLDQLTQPFHTGFTNSQATRATKQYIGKRLLVSGEVENVYGNQGGTTTIYLSDGAQHGSFSLYFGRRWKSRVRHMSQGEHITAVGKISEIAGNSVRVKRCRLVDSPSPPDQAINS